MFDRCEFCTVQVVNKFVFVFTSPEGHMFVDGIRGGETGRTRV